MRKLMRAFVAWAQTLFVDSVNNAAEVNEMVRQMEILTLRVNVLAAAIQIANLEWWKDQAKIMGTNTARDIGETNENT